MDLDIGPVKTPRPYNTSGRRDKAREARTRSIRTAEQLFLRDGYLLTTVAALAAAAGVSVETIYKTFGGKAGMVRAIWQSGLAGEGAVPAPERSDEMVGGELEPRTILRRWADLTIEVSPRVAPIVLLVRAAAATDHEMANLLDEINDQRLNRMQDNARRLVRRGPLRSGVSIAQARDVMFTYTAPELYEILVGRQHWSLAEYGDFVFRGLVAGLLGEVRRD